MTLELTRNEEVTVEIAVKHMLRDEFMVGRPDYDIIDTCVSTLRKMGMTIADLEDYYAGEMPMWFAGYLEVYDLASGEICMGCGVKGHDCEADAIEILRGKRASLRDLGGNPPCGGDCCGGPKVRAAFEKQAGTQQF